MSADPRERSRDDDVLSYLEALLTSIVFGAGAYVTTFVDFLFRPRRFDTVLLSDGPQPPSARRYLPPLSFLLLNQIFYFYVYPRQERGPTRTVIAAMPGPIRHALDRIESSIREPNLVSVLLVVGPLVLLAALHALFTTWGFRALGRPHVRFAAILETTCYSVGTMLGALALSAVLGATLTDRALGGGLAPPVLAAYVVLLVLPFAMIWLRCIGRHFAVVRTTTRSSWAQTIAVVLGATLALGVLVAALLALAGDRGP